MEEFNLYQFFTGAYKISVVLGFYNGNTYDAVVIDLWQFPLLAIEEFNSLVDALVEVGNTKEQASELIQKYRIVFMGL